MSLIEAKQYIEQKVFDASQDGLEKVWVDSSDLCFEGSRCLLVNELLSYIREENFKISVVNRHGRSQYWDLQSLGFYIYLK